MSIGYKGLIALIAPNEENKIKQYEKVNFNNLCCRGTAWVYKGA